MVSFYSLDEAFSRKYFLKWFPGFCLFLSIGVASFWLRVKEINSIESNRKHQESLYNKLLITADTNKDGIITRDEWIKVYQELGIHIDELRPPDPRLLSNSQLEKYLANHGLKIPDYKDCKIKKMNDGLEEWLNSYNYK